MNDNRLEKELLEKVAGGGAHSENPRLDIYTQFYDLFQCKIKAFQEKNMPDDSLADEKKMYQEMLDKIAVNLEILEADRKTL